MIRVVITDLHELIHEVHIVNVETVSERGPVAEDDPHDGTICRYKWNVAKGKNAGLCGDQVYHYRADGASTLVSLVLDELGELVRLDQAQAS